MKKMGVMRWLAAALTAATLVSASPVTAFAAGTTAQQVGEDTIKGNTEGMDQEGETKVTTDGTKTTETASYKSKDGLTTVKTVKVTDAATKTETTTITTTTVGEGTTVSEETVVVAKTNEDGTYEVSSKTISSTSKGKKTTVAQALTDTEYNENGYVVGETSVVTDKKQAATIVVKKAGQAQNNLSTTKKKPTSATFNGVGNSTDALVKISDVNVDGKTYAVTAIKKNAMRENITAKTLVIDSKVTSIGANAFRDCSSLSEVKINASNLKPNKLGKNSLAGISSSAEIKLTFDGNVTLDRKTMKKYMNGLKKALGKKAYNSLKAQGKLVVNGINLKNVPTNGSYTDKDKEASENSVPKPEDASQNGVSANTSADK